MNWVEAVCVRLWQRIPNYTFVWENLTSVSERYIITNIF